MARLPQPGSDAGQWGTILNDFLATAHTSDGNLKTGVVTTQKIADGAVTIAKLAINNTPSAGQTLTYDGTELSWSTPSGSGSVPDATASVKGLVQLAGDLGGTSAAPTVPGLAAKANTTSVVALTGDQTITGVKNFTGTLQAGGSAVVITTDSRLTNQRTPSDASVTTAKIVDANVTGAKIADNTITEPKLAVSNSPTTNQVLTWNGTALAWANDASGAGDPTVGGDLSGTASNAQIVAGAVGATELASNAVTTAKVLDANITGAKIADNTITEPKLAVSNSPTTNQVLTWNGTALAWANDATGGGGSQWSAVTVTGNHTATSGQFVIGDTTTSGFTVTLPAAANGAYVTVKKLTNNVNAVLVAPPSGQINAGSGTSSTISVNNYGQVADFIADGTTWHQVG